MSTTHPPVYAPAGGAGEDSEPLEGAMSKPPKDEHRPVDAAPSHRRGQADGGGVEARGTGRGDPRMELARANLLSRRYRAASRGELAEYVVVAAKGRGKLPILFDPEFYLRANADVRSAGIDPLEHYLGWGAIEGRMPVGDVREEDLHPLVRDLHRLDPAGSLDFDVAFYRSLYSDLASLDDEALADHYLQHGRREGRVRSLQDFAGRLCDSPREIPLDFDPDEYLELFPRDLEGAFEGPHEVLQHYMRNGRWESRFYSYRALRENASMSRGASMGFTKVPSVPSADTPPLCLLAHVYYPELWDELAGYIGNLPKDKYDLYVNLVDAAFDHEIVSRIRDRFPSARIYVSENRGRDVGGHVRLLENVRIECYSMFCLVHTKMSPFMDGEEVARWRSRLLGPLMGTKKRARENVNLMLKDRTIGQMAARKCRYTEVDGNREKYELLLDRLDIGAGAREVECVTGTMMFLRAEVLRRLFDGIRDLPFEDGSGRSPDFHRDGQWEHAVERVIGSVVRDMNYRFEWR